MTGSPLDPLASSTRSDLTDLFGLADPGALAGRQILVLDDSEDGRRLMARLLTREGAAVEVFESGYAVIARLEEEDARFDLLLLDVEMPILSGRETVRRLRELGLESPVVALTAHQDPEEHAACLEAGFDAIETKPVDVDRFVERCRSRMAGS